MKKIEAIADSCYVTAYREYDGDDSGRMTSGQLRFFQLPLGRRFASNQGVELLPSSNTFTNVFRAAF